LALAALIMAGGKGTRMRTTTEKPLLHIGNKSMIQRVIEALKQSRFVVRIIVAVTPNTIKTAEMAIALAVEITETAGEGYEHDMKQAIKSLGLEDVVVVSADLPFLQPGIVDEAIMRYLAIGKPALMVAAPIELHQRYNMEASYSFELNGQKLAPVGLNIINGRRIDEPRLEETVFVVQNDDLVFNVNTQTNLETTRNHVEK